MRKHLTHTNDPAECYVNEIKSIAETCDHEYYMSAMGPSFGTLERAKRGRSRILKGIVELETIHKKTVCAACRQETKRQIDMQRKGILEIENAWSLKE